MGGGCDRRRRKTGATQQKNVTQTNKDMNTLSPGPENEDCDVRRQRRRRQYSYYIMYTNVAILGSVWGRTTDNLILPFLESEVGVGALDLDHTLSFRVPHAHAELEGRWFACLPQVYRVCWTDCTTIRLMKEVERPENAAMQTYN